jgi:TAT (twin-arginine translocation) pathway signal sequence
MSDNARRTFMKTGAALASALALPSCTSEAPNETAVKAAEKPETLAAVAGIVLPGARLGEEGVRRVVDGFRKWLDELEPVAELDHAYIFTDEILYGPPDPAPLFTAQLEALELEAEKRHETSFTAIPREEQEAILRRQLPPNPGTALPDPARAPHVALGLLAYFFQSSEANDLCYERAIERTMCRGVESGAVEPPARRS